MSKHSAIHAALKHLTQRLTGDSQLSNEHRALANRIDTAAAELVALHDAPDPMLSSLAINLRVEAARAGLKTLASEARTKSAALIATEKANVEANRNAKANMTPSPFAAEIRAVVRGLDTAGKLKILNDAVASGDGGTIAALCDCPGVISGLAPSMASDYRKMYLQKAVPLDVSYIAATEETIGGVLQAADSLLAS